MVSDILRLDLLDHLRQLSLETGSISPSVYDTAMLLRLLPANWSWPTFNWLCDQQHADGGWGHPDEGERARTVSTLAALLALNAHTERQETRQRVTDGVVWLQRTALAWGVSVPEDAPVAVELLLPMLLADAQARGIHILTAPYQSVVSLGARRRARIAQLESHHIPGSTAAHSWEAFGSDADPALVDPVSGVGASPAATAAWLRDAPQSSPARALALDYLQRAEQATGTGIMGVVPAVFPISGFMATYGFHTLAQAGLLEIPGVREAIAPALDALAAQVKPNGVGFVSGITPDADDTAAVLGALQALGRPVDVAPLRRFVAGDHVATYIGELQPSLITTARATQVLAAAGEDVTQLRQWIAGRQHIDGRWRPDKWNAYSGYSTWQAILALRDDPCYGDTLQRGARIIEAYQHPDGGWGVSCSTPEATAYNVLALAALPAERRSELVQQAIRGGSAWLLQNYRPFVRHQERYWTGKEPYTPYRLSRLIVLAAMLTQVEP